MSCLPQPVGVGEELEIWRGVISPSNCVVFVPRELYCRSFTEGNWERRRRKRHHYSCALAYTPCLVRRTLIRHGLLCVCV